MTFKEELAERGLTVHFSEAEDREPIDFEISDGNDNVAWVWGSEPFKDVQVECNHPEECIEWGDDDECGECLLCGAQCHWHYETETIDNYPDEIKEVKVRVPPDLFFHHGVSGIIGRYLEHLQKEW